VASHRRRSSSWYSLSWEPQLSHTYSDFDHFFERTAYISYLQLTQKMHTYYITITLLPLR
jgi:hypothetical protein